jgi:hypothetical protein
LVASNPAQAIQQPEILVLIDEEIRADLKNGEDIETRVDGDMNGDGDIDTAYIVRGEDTR